MNPKDLKYVVDGYEAGKPAIIRFYGDVDYWNVADFNSEFVWLEEYVEPSKITILINSAGGSIIEGMSTFSVIQNCKIPTECVIEGIAASMGSIIWAAGDRCFMHDYSILMIHNPFMRGADPEDESTKQAIAAFKAQLEMIYCKRFSMSIEQVREIMEGEGEADGTYLSAEDAVNRGFIDRSHVISTDPTIFNSIRHSIEGIQGATEICHAMAAAIGDVNGSELLEAITAITDKTDNPNLNNQAMNENVLFDSVVAQLGLTKEAGIASVSAAITEMQNKAKELEDIKNQFEALQIQFNGKEAEAQNLQANLEKAEAALKVYQDKEAAAFDAEVENLVSAAITAGKISEDSKEQWVAMAHSNYEMVKATLASIPGRTVITEEIKNDPVNQQAAKDALDAAELEMKKKVSEVLGADFELKKF